MATSVLDSTFQSFIVLSPDPDASKVPSLLNATELTHFECPSRVATSVLDSTFQSFIVLSADPDECPFRVATSVLDSTFQSFIVLSRDPDASKVPALLNATELHNQNALLANIPEFYCIIISSLTIKCNGNNVM